MEKTKDLSVYENRFNQDPGRFNDFQAMDYVKELKNQGKLDEAIEVGKTFLQYEGLTSFINQYAYALYNKYINIDDEAIDAKPALFESIAEEIISLTKQEKYSPLEVTVNKLMKQILKTKPVDYTKLSKLLDRLNPELSDNRPMQVNGFEAESRRERWYRLKVRSLFELGDYKECITVATKASEEDIKWHNHALNWILFYKAQSLEKTEQYDAAEIAYLELGKGIPSGNLDDILYNLYVKTGNTNAVNTSIIYKFFLSGYDFKNVALYKQISEMIKTAPAQTELAAIADAYMHQLFVENGKEASEYALADKYADKSSSELYDRLYNVLMKNLDAYIERKSGKVTRYFEDKQYGNIATKGQYVFFRQADFIYDEDVQRHDTVHYSVVKNYDMKRHEVTTKAILIKTEY